MPYYKFSKRTAKSEQGFVLLLALIAIVILIAIGFFSLTMISGDLMITSRLVCERKAYSAAESGAHQVFWALDSADIMKKLIINGQTVNWETPIIVDPADASITYSVTQPVSTGKTVQPPGYNLGTPAYLSRLYENTVTGTTSDGCSVTIGLGVADLPSISSSLGEQ